MSWCVMRLHACLNGTSALLQSHVLMLRSQEHYSKYVEPYVNKIPRASTSTSSQAPTAPSSNIHSTADSAPLSSEPKKVI